MKLDTRTVRALVLAAWAGLFLWLWLSGESVRYLGPRTQWVVPVGAVGLSLAVIGYLHATRAHSTARVSLRELLGLAGLLVPIVAAATLAQAQLGSLAASNKLSSRGVDPSAIARLASQDASEIGFVQLHATGDDADLAGELGIAAGKPVRLTGFVSSDPAGRRGLFELSRFYMTCCVADAIPVGVHVDPGALRTGELQKNDWLEVTGVLEHGRGEWIVRAGELARVDAPSDPYLSFSS
jgi:putative membrane protein